MAANEGHDPNQPVGPDDFDWGGWLTDTVEDLDGVRKASQKGGK